MGILHVLRLELSVEDFGNFELSPMKALKKFCSWRTYKGKYDSL